jgi:hypothetical protein
MTNALFCALAIPIGVTSYLVTRGSDGQLILCFQLFGLWSAIYAVLCWIGAKRLRDVLLPLHMIVVPVPGVIATATRSTLRRA